MKIRSLYYLVLTCLICSSCFGGSKIWGLKRSDILDRMKNGETESLQNIDYSALSENGRIREIDRLGSHGAFFYAHLFSSADSSRNRILFLEHAAGQEQGLFLQKTLQELFQYRIEDTERFEFVAAIAMSYFNDHPEDTETLDKYIAFLYRHGEYGMLLNQNIPEQMDSDWISVYRILAEAYLDNTGWQDDLSDFLFNSKTSPAVVFLYDNLSVSGLNERLDPPVGDYLAGKALLFERDYNRAFRLMDSIFQQQDLRIHNPHILYDLRFSSYGNGTYFGWADVLSKELSFYPSEEDRAVASFIAGRFYRHEERYEEAAGSFLQSFLYAENTGDEDFQDETLWYYLRTRLDLSPDTFAADLIRYADSWNDPEYFADLLEEFAVISVQEQRWQDLADVTDSVLLFGDDYEKARYCWILIAAVQYGLYEKNLGQDIYDYLLLNQQWSYYSLLAEHVMGEDFHFISEMDPQRQVSQVSTEQNEWDEYISGLEDYGFLYTAYLEALDETDNLSLETVQDLCRNLKERGEYYEAIRLLSRICYEPGYPWSGEDLETLWPTPYDDYVIPAASEFRIPGNLIYAVMRNESAFNADVVSYAGAQGLLQLMPATADERAGELGLDRWDVHDPEINIRLGTAHMQWILEREWCGSYAEMLAAYNAGGGNLRKWKRLYGELPPVLFIEAIPYKQTRDYVRKNMVAFLIYNDRTGIEPRKSVNTFFMEQ